MFLHWPWFVDLLRKIHWIRPSAPEAGTDRVGEKRSDSHDDGNPFCVVVLTRSAPTTSFKQEATGFQK